MPALDWTDILRRAGIPEPPGRAELIAAIKAERASKRRTPKAQQAPQRGPA